MRLFSEKNLKNLLTELIKSDFLIFPDIKGKSKVNKNHSN